MLMFSCKKVLLLSPFFFPLLTQRTFVKTHRYVYPQKFGNFSYFRSHQLLYKKLLQFRRQCSTSAPSFVIPTESTPQFRALFAVIAVGVGSLEDMENSLEQLNVETTQELVMQLIHSCTDLPAVASCGRGSYRSRRLLRFFTWCIRRRVIDGFDHHVFNSAIRAFAKMNDLTAVGIAQLELQKAGCRMDFETFVIVVETLVKADKADEAVYLFRSMVEKQMHLLPLQNGGSWSCISAIVHALCSKGHAKKAEGVVWHHKDKVQDEIGIIYKSLLHGWCIDGNLREARRILTEMKSRGIDPGLSSYIDLLHCICNRNLKFNPSALVSEAIDLMVEMRSCGVVPTTVCFNILLSCLGRARRVKESCRILSSMMHGEVDSLPDQDSYCLVVRVLYLTGRIVKGNCIVDRMIKNGVGVEARFFHSLIGVLCGSEKVDSALEMFEKMKKCCTENLGPTYDLLIEKLCRNGKFDAGRCLYDEAVENGIILQISRDLLDPLKTPVFEPKRPDDELCPSKNKGKLLQKRRKSNNKAKFCS